MNSTGNIKLMMCVSMIQQCLNAKDMRNLKSLLLLLVLLSSNSQVIGGSLKTADSVPWSSLVKFRQTNKKCEDEFDFLKDNKKWDFCYDVPVSQYGGDYRVDQIGSPNQLKNNNSQLFANRNCFCDNECGKYGDCCIDAAQQASLDELDEEQDEWACVNLPGAMYSTISAIYTIGKCSKDWRNEITESPDAKMTRLRCNMDPTVQIHYTQQIPVKSLDTNITYRNVYCAICNSDARIQKWSASLFCNKNVSKSIITRGDHLVDSNYYPFFKHWQFRINDQEIRCRISIKEFENGFKYASAHNARACKPVVNTCAPDWRDPKDSERCSKYASYVYRQWDSSDENVTVFKNIHCAICNRANLDYLVCVATDLTPRPEKVHLSLSILFDFNLKSGNQVGIEDHGCSIGEMYDPLRGRCMALHCGRLYKAVDGKCIRNEKATFFNNSLNSDCRTVNLSPNEYTILSNQSVYVNITNRLYHYGEYELIDPTNQSSMELAICSEKYPSNIKFSKIRITLTNICLYTSISCLSLQILFYSLVPKLRNLPGKSLLCLACCLLIGQVLMLLEFFANSYQTVCSVLAVALHFFLLAYFFWMNVMAIDICRTFSASIYRSGSGSKTFLKYSCYAWLTPIVLVAAAIVVDNIDAVDITFRPGYGKGVCWLSQRKALLVFFAAPLAIIMLINVIMFSLTIWNIKKSDDFSRRATKRSDKVRFMLYIKLALIMGLTWTLSFIAPLADTAVLWYIFIVCNGLQGLFIFVAFSCKRNVLKLVLESVRGKAADSSSSAIKRKRDSRSSTTVTNITTNTFDSNKQKLLEISLSKTPSPNSVPQTRVKKRLTNNSNIGNESHV